MVQYTAEQVDNGLRDLIFDLLLTLAEFRSDALVNLQAMIKERVEKDGLTNEQLGNEFWNALTETNRFRSGED